MSNRILDYPEATAITSDDYILLDNAGTGAKCIKASALNINMDNYTIKEARGAIASFDDGEDLPLAFMGAYITAIQEGSGDPSPSNIRPIIGWSAVDVSDNQKNYFDASELESGLYNDSDFTIIQSTSSVYRSFKRFLKAGTYTFSASKQLRILRSIIDGVYSSSQLDLPQTFTLTKDGVVGFSFRNKDDTDWDTTTNCQLEIGETATTYSPYNGNTYSLTFTDGSNPLTVYGGYVDVVSGVLTVDRAYVDLGTLDWQYSSISERFYVGASDLGVKATDASTPFNAISSALIAKSYNEIEAKTVDYAIGINPNATQFFARYSSITSASDFITAMDGVQLVYELAVPLTYSLTKQQTRSLVGENNIFADTGDSVVDYRKLWVMPEM